MTSGRVESIQIAGAAGEPMRVVPAVRAVAGRGLEGDRYFEKIGTFSAKDGADRQITLVEVEAVEALLRDYGIAIAPEETRRNVATRGIALNHLVGATFRVGGATLRGLRLCEPCSYMEKMCGKPVRPGLIHRGGLRAEILSEGEIRAGDDVEVLARAD
jgi:MOSC domain-containing protein YiiM